MTGVFIRRGKFGHSDRDTGERHVMMAAEMGVIQLQSKTDGSHQKLEGRKEGFSSSLTAMMLLLTP